MEIDKKKTGFGAVIALLLASLGANVTSLTQNQLDNAYYCQLTNEAHIFNGGLSSTKYRGYPNEENRVGYKDCRIGDSKIQWSPLIEYAKSMGVDPLTLLVAPSQNELKGEIGKVYKCDNTGCIRVN